MKALRYINLFTLLLLFSCNENKTDKVAIYDREDFYKKIKIIDTACINGEEKAKKDLNNGKAKITKENLPFIKNFLPNEIISKELKKLNISLDMTPEENYFDSIGNRKLLRSNCYQDVMRREIYQKTNRKLIDSILSLSAKNYILKHPDLIINQRDLDDRYENSGGRKFDKCLDRLKLEFTFNFKYPEEYIKGIKKTSYTTLNFIVSKKGDISNIEVQSCFNNPLNKKFSVYFTDDLIALIKSIKWTSPYSAGTPVNTNITLKLKHY